ncbi:AbiV family abortive infection protein [Vibrio vulnificus]|nr:AbiV family abortive infection protein [Vibrio vulnificus]ELP3554466.1 AbiV family abortive infection protein [Vibrio vulnificus]ELP7003301.1 AbiV family abortive infection protein [Vibrio vulnificus]
MSEEKINNAKPDVLIAGAMKCIMNAQQLCTESKLLHEHQMYARSFALSHFSREEFAKALMLYRTAIEVKCGIKVDWKRLNRRFRDHKQKLINDRLMSALICSLADTDPSDGVNIFNSSMAGIEFSNNRKNECLYVDWNNGYFHLPEEIISEELSKRNLDLATYKILILSPKMMRINEILNVTKDEARAVFEVLGQEFFDNPGEFIKEKLGLVKKT